VARTYFTPESRLVLTIVPRGGGREAPDAAPEAAGALAEALR
jgi:hypothetical protein